MGLGFEDRIFKDIDTTVKPDVANERRKVSTNLACTFGAAERLVEIRDETISKHGAGEYEPRALDEAVVAVLEVRQKTRKASDFGTDPEELY